MKTSAKILTAALAVTAMMAVAATAQNVALPAGAYHLSAMSGAAAQQNADDVKIAAAKDDLFAGTEVFAKNATDINEISMDPDSLDLVRGSNAARAHNMVLQTVRTYSYDKPGMYNMADVDKIRDRLNTGDWHCSVHQRDLKTGESTDICARHRTDGLKETAIISIEPKELSFIHIIRRAGNGPQGEVNMIPMDALGGLPILANLDPEMLALKVRMNGLNAPNMPVLDQLDAVRGNMKDYTGPEVQKQMEAAKKQLDELQKQLSTPAMQQKIKDAEKNGGIIINLPNPALDNQPPSDPAPK
jgi:hypothetical protein